MTAFFVTVPRNAQALLIRVTSPREGPGFSYGVHLPDATEALNVSNNLLVAFLLDQGVRQDIFSHPQPGTWEIIFTDARDVVTYEKRDVHPTPVVVTTALIGATVKKTPTGVRVHTLQASAPTLTLTQQTAVVATDTRTLRPGEQRVYTMEVPPGATGIGANLRSVNGSLINLYLFDCTKSWVKNCIIRTKSTQTSSRQYLYDDHPAPGLWKLIVDGYMVSPSGSSYSLQRYYLTGLPITSGPTATTFTLGTLANDPYIYYNEGGIGVIKPRNGLNPTIFDVLLPDASLSR
jgi:hypothetical protein